MVRSWGTSEGHRKIHFPSIAKGLAGGAAEVPPHPTSATAARVSDAYTFRIIVVSPGRGWVRCVGGRLLREAVLHHLGPNQVAYVISAGLRGMQTVGGIAVDPIWLEIVEVALGGSRAFTSS